MTCTAATSTKTATHNFGPRKGDVVTLNHHGEHVEVNGPGIGFLVYRDGEVDGPDHLDAPAALRKVARSFLFTGCTTCKGTRYDGACHN